MLAPSIYNDFVSNFFNDFGGFFRTPGNINKELSVCGINTDVQEFEDHYQVDMELPGYKKEDISVELKNGQLTVSAKHEEKNEEKNEEGKYIRRERYYGQCSRSFYVGKSVTKDNIHAAFENGILKLDVPKEESVPAVEEDNYISIEG